MTQNDLAQFTGTENYYNHYLGYRYTDGVKYLAEVGKCYWLLDAVFSHMRSEPFQIWTLEVKDSKAVLIMIEDTGQPEKVKQEIEFTDFPLESIKFYLIDKVLLLPSEY